MARPLFSTDASLPGDCASRYHTFLILGMYARSGAVLAFFRLSFGSLMLIYTASKCTDPSPYGSVAASLLAPFDSRIPRWLGRLASTHPWYTTNTLYWDLHTPLLALCACGMALGFGPLSRVSCLCFFWLKLVSSLQTQVGYNNHEYLYALLAFLLGILGGHEAPLSFLGQCANEGGIYTWMVLFLYLTGCAGAMLNNAVFGIAGNIAVGGMFLFVWPSIALMLGNALRQPPSSKHMQSTPHWHVLAVRLFVGLVYLFAGAAKLSPDWMSGATMQQMARSWMSTTAPQWIQVLLQSAAQSQLVAQQFAVAGAVLDLGLFSALVLPGRSWSSLRRAGTAAAFAFHLFTHFAFTLETFPWVCMSSLVVFHREDWMRALSEGASSAMHSLSSPVLLFHGVARRAMSWLAVAAAVTFLLLHVLIPLPCAVHAAFSADATFGSSCQFFGWWMMTRSIKPVSAVFFTAVDDKRAQLPLNLAGVGRVLLLGQRHALDQLEHDTDPDAKTSADRFFRHAAGNEDRLWRLAGQLRESIERHTGRSGVAVSADIWLEINGPPAQRFVQPSVDLTLPEAAITPPSTWGWLSAGLWSELLHGPRSLAPWVLPRIEKFRGGLWARRYRQLTSSFSSSSLGDAPLPIFLALAPDTGAPLAVLADVDSIEPVYLQLLAGHAELAHSGQALVPGDCVVIASGLAVVSPLNDHPSLWMVTTRRPGPVSLSDGQPLSRSQPTPPLNARLASKPTEKGALCAPTSLIAAWEEGGGRETSKIAALMSDHPTACLLEAPDSKGGWGCRHP